MPYHHPRLLWATLIAICFLLSGCAASREEVVTQLGNRFVGQNVDALVREFGPPGSTFKMNSGDTSYIWQLGNQTDINTDRGAGFAQTRYCKVSVIANKAGIVTQLKTEDSNAGGASLEPSAGLAASALVASASSDKPELDRSGDERRQSALMRRRPIAHHPRMG
jgi:hypothetical protein